MKIVKPEIIQTGPARMRNSCCLNPIPISMKPKTKARARVVSAAPRPRRVELFTV